MPLKQERPNGKAQEPQNATETVLHKEQLYKEGEAVEVEALKGE
jgi:hypothetical protein